ncbi:MAG: aminotransferase class III-fold pyridoxal phosphate-dependent enzyme [Bradymonadia bacterium]
MLDAESTAITARADRQGLLRQLERRQRLEEVAERFRCHIEVDPAEPNVGWLPFSDLKVRLAGRKATAAQLKDRARAAGLVADDVGIRLAFDTVEPGIDRVEHALTQWLTALKEADPRPFLEMPPQKINVPPEGALPTSAGWLARFYGESFLPREKKPAVVDLARCQGPFLRSVDEDALQIVDAASQIASLAAGFRPGQVQAALDEGRFDPHMVSALSPNHPAVQRETQAFFEGLLRAAPPGIRHVAWVNSGAEANEKALHIARVNGAGGRRVLAFEGSFHGRTLLSLYSTWNPVKRAPYQIPGFETDFLPFPLDVELADPVIPEGWRKSWATAGADRAAWVTAAEGDALLTAEVQSLIATEKALQAGDVMACMLEPYQCEGGDRGASSRFVNGLRALTRAYGVPLIFDEVQVGFGLGGPVFWHSLFWMLDADGQPDGPDLIVCAKRAQVGLVLSRWPDPDPAPFHSASLVRGSIHLDIVERNVTHAGLAEQRLAALVERWPQLVSRPRVYGDAFAFDLPSGPVAQKLIAQRFYRGYMVYIAGARTLRYRMNRAMRPADVEAIFDIIDTSLAALVELAGGLDGDDWLTRMEAVEVPKWVTPLAAPASAPALTLQALLAEPTALNADRLLRTEGELSPQDRRLGAVTLGLSTDVRGAAALDAAKAADPAAFETAVGVPLVRWLADCLGTRIRALGPGDFDAVAGAIEALQSEVYEPARQDEPAYLKTVAQSAEAVALVAEDPEGLVGLTLAGPLELWWALDGPRQDPNLRRHNTLYSADITVHPRAQGRGVGLRLREAQIKAALNVKRASGAPRYAFITGRNRVGHTDAMWGINQRFGAYCAQLLQDQYGAAGAQAWYYRIPLRRSDRRAFEADNVAPAMRVLDAAHGVSEPTGAAHPQLVRARQLGVFDEGALTKLTLSNFITRPYVRYAEYLREMTPRGCGHLYFTSSADEMVDKSFRALKHHRKHASTAIGVEGGQLGSVTAAARSLSISASKGQAERYGHFGWPMVPHPANGLQETLAALEALVSTHGADALLGLYIESVQRRTGRVITPEQWAALVAFRDRTGVPLVLVETTTGMGRNGKDLWWLDSVKGDPDVVLWWSGGQIGHIFSNDRWYVEKPLTLISTWDGDELSATRLLRQLYLTRDLPLSMLSRRLEDGLVAAGYGPGVLGGMGLYRTLRVGAKRASQIQHGLAASGVKVARPSWDVIALVPALTATEYDIDRLVDALRRVDQGLP